MSLWQYKLYIYSQIVALEEWCKACGFPSLVDKERMTSTGILPGWHHHSVFTILARWLLKLKYHSLLMNADFSL